MAKLGVHSEVGKLNTVMVCRPGLAHQRLTPGNCHDLLFDDVIWVHEAQKDHHDFVLKMQERGVEVLELHDMVAHTMSVVAVHAGTGRMVAEDDPAAARQALATIEATTRSAMLEMRPMLGILRGSDSKEPGTLAPAPGLGDLDALVADATINSNPAIDAARKRVPAPYLKFHVTAMVCQVTGGACQYTGRGMKESHAHLNITEKDWDRMVTIFKETLAKHGVPAKETQELLDIVGTTKADIVVAGGAK